jgi:hypothetical protein
MPMSAIVRLTALETKRSYTSIEDPSSGIQGIQAPIPVFRAAKLSADEAFFDL